MSFVGQIYFRDKRETKTTWYIGKSFCTKYLETQAEKVGHPPLRDFGWCRRFNARYRVEQDRYDHHSVYVGKPQPSAFQRISNQVHISDSSFWKSIQSGIVNEKFRLFGLKTTFQWKCGSGDLWTRRILFNCSSSLFSWNPHYCRRTNNWLENTVNYLGLRQMLVIVEKTQKSDEDKQNMESVEREA